MAGSGARYVAHAVSDSSDHTSVSALAHAEWQLASHDARVATLVAQNARALRGVMKDAITALSCVLP
jgi:hypothetical protein